MDPKLDNRPYFGFPPPPMPDINFVPVPVLPPYPHPGLDLPSAEFVEVEEPPRIDWVPATPSTAYSLMNRAFFAGRDGWDKNPLWSIRVHRDGSLIPGKLAIAHRTAYIPLAGKEVAVDEFEILCANTDALEWIATSNDNIPENAIPAGNTHIGEPLYVGRVKHRGSLTPGKVHPSHNCCYISFGGSEIAYKRYEILCEVPE